MSCSPLVLGSWRKPVASSQVKSGVHCPALVFLCRCLCVHMCETERAGWVKGCLSGPVQGLALNQVLPLPVHAVYSDVKVLASQ